MKPRSAKAKGRRLAVEVAQQTCCAFGLDPDDVRATPTSSPGPDLWLSPAARSRFPFAVECKNVERLNVWAALEQAQRNADGRVPLLVFSRNRSRVWAALPLDDLLALLQGRAGLRRNVIDCGTPVSTSNGSRRSPEQPCAVFPWPAA